MPRPALLVHELARELGITVNLIGAAFDASPAGRQGSTRGIDPELLELAVPAAVDLVLEAGLAYRSAKVEDHEVVVPLAELRATARIAGHLLPDVVPSTVGRALHDRFGLDRALAELGRLQHEHDRGDRVEPPELADVVAEVVDRCSELLSLAGLR